MTHLPVKRDVRARVVLLLFTAALVATAVAAAPAAAATPTTLKLSPQSPSVKWGAKVILNGILQTATAPPQPVDRQQILVQYSVASVHPDWKVPADSPITNSAAPYSSGEYTYSWKATRSYYWRMVFEGAGEWLPRTSNVVYVTVVPAIGKPRCPLSVKHGKKFTVSGTIKPHYRSGSKNVKVKAQRHSSGKWRTYRTYTATTRDSGSYSKYSVRLAISKKGKYRFRATTSRTGNLAAGKSAFSRSLRVK